MLDLGYKLSHTENKWWLYAAGAALVGLLVDGLKLAVLAGGAVAGYGVYQAPCCSGCQQGSGCGGNAAVATGPMRGAKSPADSTGDPLAFDPGAPGAPRTLDPAKEETFGTETIKDSSPFEDVISLLGRAQTASGGGVACS